MKTKQNTNRKGLQGFDPKIYRIMSIVFTMLSVLNIIAVTYAFMRSGYGLYHAEDALSHIAAINQNVHTINETALDMVIHCDEVSHINLGLAKVDECITEIENASEKYQKIDLAQIDPNLVADFDDAHHKIRRYHAALTAFANELIGYVQDGTANSFTYNSYIEWKYSENIEPLKDDAEVTINQLLELQSKATYEFFVRCAQQFVFVLLFLAITMTVGHLGIHKMKKYARSTAEKAEKEHIKAELSRAKSVNIAYSNVLTGFKNRYGLEADTEELLSDSSFTIAMYRLVNYQKISDRYGRNVADDFMVKLSQVLNQNYGATTDIYCTDSNEFCFVFKKDMLPAHENDVMQQIGHVLARATDVDGIQLQSNVAGCYYHSKAGVHQNCNSLLHTLDKAIGQANSQCIESGMNAVVSVNNR